MVYMFRLFFNKVLVRAFFCLMFLNVYSYATAHVKRFSITKEIYNKHYKSFENYIIKQRSDLWWGRKTHTVLMGAKILGYDDFTIKCIPLSYSFFDRDVATIRYILQSIGVDEYIYYINVLLDKCSERPGDFNWIARVTYEESKLFEQEEMKKTGHSISVLMRDTLVAAGLFVRYCTKAD